MIRHSQPKFAHDIKEIWKMDWAHNYRVITCKLAGLQKYYRAQ